jgi:hypothetical protein
MRKLRGFAGDMWRKLVVSKCLDIDNKRAPKTAEFFFVGCRNDNELPFILALCVIDTDA